MKTFSDVFNTYEWDGVSANIAGKTERDVERALRRVGQRTLDDFAALISPAAAPYLEEMAAESVRLTRRRFGNTIGLYIPMYLSNECQNSCTYCGFSFENKVERLTVDKELLVKEVEVIKQWPFEHLLLVTGESSKVSLDYFTWALDFLSDDFHQLSMEVQPLDADQYATLGDHGLNGVFVYQETYNEGNYRSHHPKGKKRDFHYRLQTPDRLGEAGIHKVGLGALVGLESWRTDAFMCKLHLDYCENTWWRTRYSLSFPRMRPYSGGRPHVDMSDRELVQLICAHRICDEEVDLSLSTRERPELRDHLFKLGFTQASAGSKTDPGGYSQPKEHLEQFEISDDRDPFVIAEVLKAQGLEPVWKDWDAAYSLSAKRA